MLGTPAAWAAETAAAIAAAVAACAAWAMLPANCGACESTVPVPFPLLSSLVALEWKIK